MRMRKVKQIVVDTHTNQSTAQRRLTSCTGASMAVRTIIMRTRAALGTLAEATEAAVEVSLKTEIVSPIESQIFRGDNSAKVLTRP